MLSVQVGWRALSWGPPGRGLKGSWVLEKNWLGSVFVSVLKDVYHVHLRKFGGVRQNKATPLTFLFGQRLAY